MKEMTRKEFLKLTGASTALLAMSHIIPTSAYADTSKIDAPSAGMYISEVVDLSGLSPVEQEKILTERNIPYDSTITYEKIVVERPAARDSYKGVPYRFQITYGNKPVKNERRSVVSPAAAAVLDRGVNILIGLTKPYIWIPFTASGLTPSQIFIYSDPSQYASTNIYTHLKIRQCEFYKDYSWQPNAFLERATIEDTTVTYALVNEGYGPQHIATYLNNSGYRARSGKCWHPSSIRGMVQNLTYTGVLRCGDARSELMPDLQIISQQQFETAQRIRDNRSVRAAADAENRTPLNIHGKSLLSGNAYCGHCGAKLELTSSRKWRKLADGSLDDTLRVRYTCYGKLRKQTECTGQTGYTVHILDEIIDKAVRQIFSKMRGIPKEQIVTKRYEKENAERKNHLQALQAEKDKAEKDLLALKAEILACIKGESVLPRETLAEMITEQEEKLTELEALCESASDELVRKAELMDNVSKLYDELISYADLYDSANFEAKKMIVNQLIRRVDVCRGYQINISFNFDLTPYIEGE